MKTDATVAAFFAASMVLFVASEAGAATITVVKSSASPDAALAVLDVLQPTTVTGGFFSNVTGSIGGVRRSPYDTLPALANIGKYNSVQGGGTASYIFDADQDSFSLLWGSPDAYNRLSFFNDGAQIDLSSVAGIAGASVTGGEIAAMQVAIPTGLTFAYVTFSGFTFDQVTMISGGNAFEYGLATATPAPVPLPAAAWMLLSALGGMGVLSRRRKA